MSDLADKKCIPCHGGIPGFEITEIHKYLKMVDGWEVKADDSKIYYLIKEFKFKNFLESQNFVKKLVVLQKQKVITQIFGLVGVMQKSKFLLML
tara:strand:+ start:212 stop:493 length:282 start_codon:yes stop_codon:yes gene_type:complete